jgi:hypothetical protein
MLEVDLEVKARGARLTRLLKAVCGDEEFPLFLSDTATLYDVCSLTAEDLISRLLDTYAITLSPDDLQLPVWKLVDRLDP